MLEADSVVLERSRTCKRFTDGRTDRRRTTVLVIQKTHLSFQLKTHLILTYLYVMIIKVSELNCNSEIKALCTVHKILGWKEDTYKQAKLIRSLISWILEIKQQCCCNTLTYAHSWPKYKKDDGFYAGGSHLFTRTAIMDTVWVVDANYVTSWYIIKIMWN